MGYARRSEVVIAVAPELVDEFLAIMAANESVRDLLKKDIYDEGIQFNKYSEGDIFVHFGSIEWYEGYPAIKLLADFFTKHFTSEHEEFIRFIRIGEDWLEDIECFGYYYEDKIFVPNPQIQF
jgi:hypothetical protein